MNIYDHDRKYHRALELLEQKDITKKNKKLIKDCINDLALENLSKTRLLKYISILKIVAFRLGKDMDRVSKEELKEVVSEIQQKDFSPWTKHAYKVIIRRFYKWLHGTEEYPEIVKWISIRMSKKDMNLPAEGDLLVEEEVRKMLDEACHPRDKAFLALLWETGARVGEIGTMRIKSVNFDKHGAVLSVKGKTGSRKIRVIWAVSYLSTWINAHPYKLDGNSPIWINIGTRGHKKVMSYASMRMLVIRLAKKAGISKHVHPHLFRHSRATFMAHHLTEFQMNQYFGWIQGSDMPSTYVHMSGKNVDNAILKMNGLEVSEEEDETKLRPHKCSRCDTINSHDSKFCSKCGGIVDLNHAIQIEEKQKELDARREKIDQVMNKLGENPKFWKMVNNLIEAE